MTRVNTITIESSDDDVPAPRTPCAGRRSISSSIFLSDDSDNEAFEVDQSPRGHKRRTNHPCLDLEEEVISLDSEPLTDSDTEPLSTNVDEIHLTSKRELFRQALARRESVDDIQLLYPKSLHPGFQYPEQIWKESLVL
jgi:hypothetical protein